MGIIKNTIKDVSDFIGLDAEKAKAYFIAGGNPIKAKFIYDKIKSSTSSGEYDNASGNSVSQHSQAIKYARNPSVMQSSFTPTTAAGYGTNPIMSKVKSEEKFNDIIEKERENNVFSIDKMKKLGKIKDINIISNRKNNIFGLFDMFTIPIDQTMFGRNMFRTPEEVLTEKGKRYNAIHYTTMLLEHILEASESMLPKKGSYMERFFQMDENRFMARLRGSFIGQVWIGVRDKIQDVFDALGYAMKGVRGIRNLFKIGRVRQTWAYTHELGLNPDMTTQQKNIHILEGIYSGIRSQTEMFKTAFKLEKNDYLPFIKTKAKFSIFGLDFFKKNVDAYDKETGEFTKNTSGMGIVGAGLNFAKEDFKKSDFYKDYISHLIQIPGNLRDEIMKNMSSVKDTFKDYSFSDKIIKGLGVAGKSTMKYLSQDIKAITDKNYRGDESVVSDADIVKPVGSLPTINPKKYADAVIREIKSTAPRNKIGDLVGSFKSLSGKIIETKGLTNREKYLQLVNLSNSFTGVIPETSNVIEDEKPKSPLDMIKNLMGFGGAVGGSSIFGSALSKLGSIGSGAIGVAGGLAGKAASGLATILGKLGGLLGKAGKGIMDGLIKVGKPIFSFIGKAGAAIAPYVLPILGVAGAAFIGYKIGNLISDKVFSVFNNIGEFFSNGLIKGGKFIEKRFGSGSIAFIAARGLAKLLGIDIKDKNEELVDKLGGAVDEKAISVTSKAIKDTSQFKRDIINDTLINPKNVDIGRFFDGGDKSKLNTMLKGFNKVADNKYKSGDKKVDLWNKYKYYTEVINYMREKNPDLLSRKWDVLGKGEMTMEEYLISKKFEYGGKLSELSKTYGYGKNLEKFVDDKKHENIISYAKDKANFIKGKGMEAFDKIKDISAEEFKRLPKETQKKLLFAMSKFSDGAGDIKDLYNENVDKLIQNYNTLKNKFEAKLDSVSGGNGKVAVTDEFKKLMSQITQTISAGMTNIANTNTNNVVNNNQQVNPSDSVMDRLEGNTISIMKGSSDPDYILE